MNYLLFLIPLIAFSFPTKKLEQGEMQVYQMDKDTDISSLNAPKNYLKDNKKENKNISVKKGNLLLKRILNKRELKAMSLLDKDILIKSALSYSKADLLKKYKNKISKNKLLEIREAIRNIR